MRKVKQKRHQTKCSKCKTPLSPERVGKNSYCKDCHAKYQREHRKPYALLSDIEKKKSNARSYAKVYLRRGLISKKPCEKCGNPKSEMHHSDYDKPLLISWLCRQCHLEEHDFAIELEKSDRQRERNDNGQGRKHTCSKCGNLVEESRRGKYGYCKKCHANHMRNSRKISCPCN